jgi:hypothetical protein
MYVYLSAEGQEAVALGKEPSTWCYSLYPQPIVYEGFTGMLIGEVAVTLPTREACMEPVLAQLKAKEQQVQAEAYEEMMEIKARRDALLCLTMEEASHD